jgi:uncharacterized protein
MFPPACYLPGLLMDHFGARAFILLKLREELPPQRTYHSLEHTLDVYASAIDIAEKEGINGEDLTLLKTAALFHDAGFIEKDDDHEEAGCALVRRYLPDFGFSEEQMDRICAMIRATKVPQQPNDALSRILCDADLDYLGRGDFHRIGRTLFEEFKAYGVLDEEEEWNRKQIAFLESHRFFTSTNIRSREPSKQEHLEQLRVLVGKANK